MIADPWLCYEENRKIFTNLISTHFPNAEIEMLFWENNLEKCLENITKRNDGRYISEKMVRNMSDNYHPPKIDFYAVN